MVRSEEHTSELQPHSDLVCRLLLEKKKPGWSVLAGKIACVTHFGDRVSACVFTSRLCLSTTRRNSRSIVLNASWITLLSGWCVPLSICLSSATSSWPRATVTSIRQRYGFLLGCVVLVC